MLYVHFQLGPNRYALEARTIVEILPLLELKPVPQSPRGLAGIFLYRGQPVPALDLCALTLGRPAREHLSTRILIVEQTGRGKGTKVGGRSQTLDPRPAPRAPDQLIGLIAERVAGTLQREEKDFLDVGVKMVGASFLGPALMDAQGIIQILDAQKLLATGAHPLQLTIAPEAEVSPPLPPAPPSPKAHGVKGAVRSGERAT